MNELEKTALNEILRTVTYIAEKVDGLTEEVREKMEPSVSALTTEEKEEFLGHIREALSKSQRIDYGGKGDPGYYGPRAFDP